MLAYNGCLMACSIFFSLPSLRNRVDRTYWMDSSSYNSFQRLFSVQYSVCENCVRASSALFILVHTCDRFLSPSSSSPSCRGIYWRVFFSAADDDRRPKGKWEREKRKEEKVTVASSATKGCPHFFNRNYSLMCTFLLKCLRIFIVSSKKCFASFALAVDALHFNVHSFFFLHSVTCFPSFFPK